jgi:hypothetical protein
MGFFSDYWAICCVSKAQKNIFYALFILNLCILVFVGAAYFLIFVFGLIAHITYLGIGVIRKFNASFDAEFGAREAEAQRQTYDDRKEYALRKRLNEERSKSASFFYKEETKEDKTKDWLSTD